MEKEGEGELIFKIGAPEIGAPDNVRRVETIPYRWELDDEGYSYTLYIEWEEQPVEVFICESGVHLEYYGEDGHTFKFVDTNIIPKHLFGDLHHLEQKHFKYILQRLIDSDMEGQTWPVEEVEALYKKWKELGEP